MYSPIPTGKADMMRAPTAGSMTGFSSVSRVRCSGSKVAVCWKTMTDCHAETQSLLNCGPSTAISDGGRRVQKPCQLAQLSGGSA